MFGKIRGKLGDIFKKNEEHIEENADEIIEEEVIINEDVSEITKLSESEDKKESKGFLGSLFSKKTVEDENLDDLDDIKEDNLNEEEQYLAEELQNAVLEGVEEKEKEKIKSGKDLTEKEIKINREEVEETIKKEEIKEKETHTDIPEPKENEVEKALENQENLEEKPLEVPNLDDVTDVSKEEEIQKKSAENIGEETQENKKESRSFLGGLFSKKKVEKEEEINEKSLDELPVIDEVEDNIIIENVEEETNDESSQDDEGFFSKALNVVKKKKITEDDYDKIWLDLEIFLLEINIAYEIVEKINLALKETLIGNSYDRFGLSETVRSVMVSSVEEILKTREGHFLDEISKVKETSKDNHEPLKIMMLGVNGTGKTTSIGKIIKYLQNQNLSVVVAAADTFRAAAVDQIAKHCENLGVKCIQHQNGGDPAAVAFDAVEHAKAKCIDVVLIDTAGRMPNNSNLMLELQKIKRVSKAQLALFIGDSISGNDLIDQINLFDQCVEINGVVLTKVDTDERPGSVVTCAYSIEKPIYFLGVGQGYDDLIKFDAKVVAEKLFDVDD